MFDNNDKMNSCIGEEDVTKIDVYGVGGMVLLVLSGLKAEGFCILRGLFRSLSNMNDLDGVLISTSFYKAKVFVVASPTIQFFYELRPRNGICILCGVTGGCDVVNPSSVVRRPMPCGSI